VGGGYPEPDQGTDRVVAGLELAAPVGDPAIGRRQAAPGVAAKEAAPAATAAASAGVRADDPRQRPPADEVVANELQRIGARAAVDEPDLAVAKGPVTPAPERLVEDRVLARAHIVGKAPRVEDELAHVRAVRWGGREHA
jgi:hypothetical protein